MTRAEPAPAPVVYTVATEDVAVMCAWLIVMNRVPVDHLNMFAIDALDDFSTRACIECVPCDGLALPLTITAAVQHLRKPGRRHHLSINEARLRVIP